MFILCSDICSLQIDRASTLTLTGFPLERGRQPENIFKFFLSRLRSFMDRHRVPSPHIETLDGASVLYIYVFFTEACSSLVVKALCYKSEGRRFETR
jgi:hypothetical protein